MVRCGILEPNPERIANHRDDIRECLTIRSVCYHLQDRVLKIILCSSRRSSLLADITTLSIDRSTRASCHLQRNLVSTVGERDILIDIERRAMPYLTTKRSVVVAARTLFRPSTPITVERRIRHVERSDIHRIGSRGSIHQVLLETGTQDGIDLEFANVATRLVGCTLCPIREIAVIPRSEVTTAWIIPILNRPASIRISKQNLAPFVCRFIDIVGVVLPSRVPFSLERRNTVFQVPKRIAIAYGLYGPRLRQDARSRWFDRRLVIDTQRIPFRILVDTLCHSEHQVLAIVGEHKIIVTELGGE